MEFDDLGITLFMLGFAAAPIVLGLVILRSMNAKSALIAIAAVLVLSMAGLAVVGLGPHAFILIPLVPMWAGCIVSMIITTIVLVRARMKGKAEETSDAL